MFYVPLAQTPDTLRMQPWDRDQIHRLFDDLEPSDFRRYGSARLTLFEPA